MYFIIGLIIFGIAFGFLINSLPIVFVIIGAGLMVIGILNYLDGPNG
jgi:hypothetical protein